MSWKTGLSGLWRSLLASAGGPAPANFFSLGVLRATDALVLLFLIPVIIGRVGIANFGAIAFVQVWLNYGKTVIDYGFHISGVREIAMAQAEPHGLSRIFSNIFFTRAAICLALSAVLFGGILLFPYLHARAPAFYWGIFLLLGHVFFFDWFFIGLQKAKYAAAANLSAKLLYAALVIALVREPSDYVYVLAFQGISAGIAGLGLLGFMWRKLGVGLRVPQWWVVTAYLLTDFKLLLTNLSIEFNGSYGILVLERLTTDALTGYFSVMHKLVQPLRMLEVVFSQTIFPIVCNKTKEGWAAVRAFLHRSFLLFSPLPLGGVLLLLLFAGPLLRYFAGEVDDTMLTAFRVYALVPAVVLFNIPAYQALLAYERKTAYTKVYLSATALKIFLDPALVMMYGLPGLAVSVLAVEVFITLGLYWMVVGEW